MNKNTAFHEGETHGRTAGGGLSSNGVSGSVATGDRIEQISESAGRSGASLKESITGIFQPDVGFGSNSVGTGSDLNLAGSTRGDSLQSPNSDRLSDASVSGRTNIDDGLKSSLNTLTGANFNGGFGSDRQKGITITRFETEDVFTTVTNVIYNSIPVTLTQFIKTTAVSPTLLVSVTVSIWVLYL